MRIYDYWFTYISTENPVFMAGKSILVVNLLEVHTKAVATMAVPTMISMLVVVIYNMADTFFIGQTKNPLQVAAVSLATPVFMIFMVLGYLFGIGGSAGKRSIF